MNGTLHFHTVKHSDKGRYTCVATNSEGLINTTIYVDVGGEFQVEYMLLSLWILLIIFASLKHLAIDLFYLFSHFST